MTEIESGTIVKLKSAGSLMTTAGDVIQSDRGGPVAASQG